MQFKPVPALTEKQVKSFWSRVMKTKSCWIWKGMLTTKGYGYFSISIGKGCYERRIASRVSYKLHYGIDLEFCACHKCDNPKCVNPLHLFDAPKSENHYDAVRKGRNSKHEGHRCAKLNRHIVRECRKRWKAGEFIKTLAKEFKVDERTISDAVHERTWRGI